MDELNKYVGHQYDEFQKTLEKIEKPAKYLNYGYTTSSNRRATYEEKQERLCLETFKLADIKPHHHIVDVGFGSSEQDFLLYRNFPFARLDGFNVAQTQVHYANTMATNKCLDEKLKFHHSPAENMSALNDNSVDRVIAIECAFYFDRSEFYKEAARILKPGGRLVLADISFGPQLKFLTRRSEDMRRVGLLSENRRLWEEHFSTREVINITKETRPGTQKTVFKCLSSVFMQLSFAEVKTWLKMAYYSQLVALGLATGFVSYDFIVLEKDGREL
jgi:ubiquinone/menaquinone biosynthesis C-methylase UbiE